MIESCYWRAELRADIRWLRVKRRYRRWSEKQLVLYERKLVMVAFQVRALIEQLRVNDQVRALKLEAVEYKKVGDRPFTRAGGGWPEDRFDMSSPGPVELSVLDVCNQLIHHYWMSTFSERGAFAWMLVFSDYKRHTCAYGIEIGKLIEMFSAFGDDDSAIAEYRMQWSEKKKDYVTVYARGRSA